MCVAINHGMKFTHTLTFTHTNTHTYTYFGSFFIMFIHICVLLIIIHKVDTHPKYYLPFFGIKHHCTSSLRRNGLFLLTVPGYSPLKQVILSNGSLKHAITFHLQQEGENYEHFLLVCSPLYISSVEVPVRECWCPCFSPAASTTNTTPYMHA